MAVGIIGDIHGCYEQAIELTERLINEHGADRIVLLGDLLDKGPAEKCAQTVSYFRNLSNSLQVDLVLSNHEEKHSRFRKRLEVKDGSINNYKNWQEMLEITQQLSPLDVEWLEKAALYHRVPEYNIVCVHAGISPSIKRLPTFQEMQDMSSRERKHYYQMLRVRHVNKNGYMVGLGDESPEDPYWAEVYDGRFGRCVFGHQPFMQTEPKYYDHAVGIDLGCVFGGKLCSIVFKEDAEYVLTVDGHKWCEPHSYMEKR